MTMRDEKFAPDITVDRDQPIIVTVTFEEKPDEIDFYYTKPKEERPYADDGYGQKRSRIIRLSDTVYRCTFSTVGFKSGDGVWHFKGSWKKATKDRPYIDASIFGRYHVNSAPEQLL